MVYQVFVQTPTRAILLGESEDALSAIEEHAEAAVAAAPKNEIWTIGAARELPDVADRLDFFSNRKRYATSCYVAACAADRKKRKYYKDKGLTECNECNNKSSQE